MAFVSLNNFRHIKQLTTHFIFYECNLWTKSNRCEFQWVWGKINNIFSLFKLSIVKQRCQPLWNILTSILNCKCLSCSVAKFYWNYAIHHDKNFQFKILVNIFRSGWHLWCRRKDLEITLQDAKRKYRRQLACFLI